MTNPSSIKELVQILNDQGAQLIVEGSYSEAIQLSCTGLAFVVEIQKNLPSSSSSTSTSHNVMSADLVRDLKLAADKCMSNDVDGSTERAKPGWMGFSDSSSCLFSSMSGNHSNFISPPSQISSGVSTTARDKPFLFRHPMFYDHFKATPDILFLDTACFSMVFNMAICHHMRACIMGSRESLHQDMLQADAYAALVLYDIAFQLATSDQASIPLVFSCAVLNNAARLQCEMKDVKAFSRHSSTLLGFLLYCVDTNQQGRCCDTRDDSIRLLREYLPDFFGAVSHLILSTQTANAA